MVFVFKHPFFWGGFGTNHKISGLGFTSNSAMALSEVIFQAEYRYPISDFLACHEPGMLGLTVHMES